MRRHERQPMPAPPTHRQPDGRRALHLASHRRPALCCAACRTAKVRCDRLLPCARCVRLQLECAPPMPVQRGRPSRLRLMQRNLEQQTLAGNAGLGMVADDSGNTHLLKDTLCFPLAKATIRWFSSDVFT